MHKESHDFVKECLGLIGSRERVVEIGSRDINGSIKKLFNGSEYIGVDLVDGKNVDVVADAAEWQPEMLQDLVVCASVLEHTPRGFALVESAARMLLPGGFFVVTTVADPWPEHSAVDGGTLRAGEHYNNLTKGILERWVKMCFGEAIVRQDGANLLGMAQK